ncbi:MAG: DUF2798 domain-containing protein [Dinoroseobacter sp.]|nr:DUF2798 domain-containing protein [Dinoroseobacter sp.]
MLPAKFAPYLFALILSGFMSLIVSGLVSYKALGLVDGFFGIWMEAWAFAWAVAFPSALFVAPIARKLVARVTAQPNA